MSDIMRALSIRQPYAELILRGVKTIEYRSRPTRIIGERFYIYASKGNGSLFGAPSSSSGSRKAKKIWSDNLVVPGDAKNPPPPPWMLELAHALTLGTLPVGVIVGSAVVEKVTPLESREGMYCWHLAEVERAKTLRRPRGMPQPVWFTPF